MRFMVGISDRPDLSQAYVEELSLALGGTVQTRLGKSGSLDPVRLSARKKDVEWER